MNPPTTMPEDRTTLTPGSGNAIAFKVCLLLQVIAIVVAGAGILRLRGQAGALPKIIAFTADHRAVTGDPKAYVMSDERFESFSRDVVEAALARTEKGLPPALRDFVTEAAGAKLLAQAASNRPRGGTPFVQTFQVDAKDGVRIVSGNMMVARVKLRGVLTTRSTDAMLTGRYFWGAQFVSGPITTENPIGWRLNDLFEMTAADFIEEDTAKAAAEAVKLPNTKTKS